MNVVDIFIIIAMALFSQNTTCIGFIHQSKIPVWAKN